MEKWMCPYCDQSIKTKHYCPGCRRFVKNPAVWNVDYYLNERHPAGETDCLYHAPTLELEPSGGFLREKQKTGQQTTPQSERKFLAADGKEKRRREKEWTKKERTEKGRTAKERTDKKKSSWTSRIITFILILFVFPGIFDLLLETASDFMSLFDSAKQEEAAIEMVPETGEESDLDKILEPGFEGEITAEAAKALGVPCTSFGHFDVTADQLVAVLEERFAENIDFSMEPSVFSYNDYAGDFRYFESQYSRPLEESGEYRGFLDISYDTATDQVHSVSVTCAYGDTEWAIPFFEELMEAAAELGMYDGGKEMVEYLMAGALDSFENPDNPEPGSGSCYTEDEDVRLRLDIFGTNMEYIEFNIRKMEEEL